MLYLFYLIKLFMDTFFEISTLLKKKDKHKNYKKLNEKAKLIILFLFSSKK